MLAPQVHAPTIQHVGFILLESYSMIAFANAVEVLRMANQLSGQPHYRWTIASVDGDDSRASNGLSMAGSGTLADLDACDLVFVCGGIEVQKAIGEALVKDLRRRAARGQALGGICTGSQALAEAGVMNGYRCAVHWENLAALREACPRVRFALEVFVVDRDRYTVIRDGREIALPRKEFALLDLLCSSPGRLIPREEIYAKIWGTEVVVGDRTIDVHIRKLRQKIGDERIVTVKGVGYKYEP